MDKRHLSVDSPELLYSDKHLIVVNKPSGLLSVPGRGPDKKDCVVARLQAKFPTVRVVHRLDCATSGLMVLALGQDSHRELSRQFHDREVGKEYRAHVVGHCTSEQGEVDQPLITDWPNRPRQKICPEGKSALTKFKCLGHDYLQDLPITKMSLKPVTGRSHQLRVHMQHLGHPILGDQLYATGPALEASNRLLLHARTLTFNHPVSKEPMQFECHESF